MKKIFLFFLLIFAAGRGFSQSLEDINEMIGNKKYTDAKTAIDKYLAEPKNANEANGYYVKGFIYNALSKNPSVSTAESYNYKVAAFEAFRKNQQLDKLDLMLKTEFYISYLDLYLELYNLGGRQFNDKNYRDSYTSFVKAQELENFMLGKKYTYKEAALHPLDTGLVMNIAASALQANDSVNAVSNYRKLTDANVTGKDYELVYEFLTTFYRDRQDNANLQAILAKAKAAYPKNNYWSQVETDNIAKSGDQAAVMARYDELYRTDPANFTNTYNYAVVLYNGIYGKDAKNPAPELKDKLTEVLNTAAKSDRGTEATLLLSNHLFNWAADYSTEAALIKSTKPEDVKKKKDLNTLAMTKMDEAVPYAERVIKYYTDKPPTTTKEKLNYQAAIGYLSDIYNAKGNPKKAAEYDKMRDAIKF